MQPILTDGPISAQFLDGARGPLMLVFSSIGHDPSRAPSPEFIATARGGDRRVLFISDASRSWGNHPRFAPALLAAVAQVGADRIVAMGLSMGGFCALVAAHILPVETVIAFGPQQSLLAETRWPDWRAQLPPLLWPEAPLPACQTYLFHGARDDLAQAERFALSPNIDHILFADQTHSSLVPYLKARGGLAGIVEAAVSSDRRRLLRITASAGGVRRKRAAPRGDPSA